MPGLEMAVPCCSCFEWVELNDTRESELYGGRNRMLCHNCYDIESEVKSKIDEIKDIQLMLGNDDEEVKGKRREYKQRIKDLRKEVSDLGYSLDDHL